MTLQPEGTGQNPKRSPEIVRRLPGINEDSADQKAGKNKEEVHAAPGQHTYARDDPRNGAVKRSLFERNNDEKPDYHQQDCSTSDAV
jgi:hypothetical protein